MALPDAFSFLLHASLCSSGLFSEWETEHWPSACFAGVLRFLFFRCLRFHTPPSLPYFSHAICLVPGESVQSPPLPAFSRARLMPFVAAYHYLQSWPFLISLHVFVSCLLSFITDAPFSPSHQNWSHHMPSYQHYIYIIFRRMVIALLHLSLFA